MFNIKNFKPKIISYSLPAKKLFRSTNMSVFVQKLNALTGVNEWVVQDEQYDYHQEIARSAFADMLHDTDRNKKYYQALRIAIRARHAAGKKAHVLDIGTGTGLLSMMAATCKADSIVACECFPPIASVAREVISKNGFKDKIKVVSKRSTELIVGEDLAQKANILVAEVFDTELIGEGAIETFNHAKKHLLEEDAVVIPSIGRMMACVVESKLLGSHQRPVGSWSSRSGANDLNLPQELLDCRGTPALHDLQASEIPSDSFILLTRPIQLFSFDFSRGQIPKYSEVVKRVEVEREGRGDCLVVWWELDMLGPNLTDEMPVISCAPTWILSDSAWRDHWMQAVYHFTHPLPLSPHLPSFLGAFHDQYSLWFHIDTKEERCHGVKAPVCTCGFHVVTSRSRVALMNSLTIWQGFMGVLSRLISSESVLAFLGDTSLIPLAAALLGAKHVYCFEENQTAFNVMNRIIEENNLKDKVTLLPNYDANEIREKVTLVLSEPYFRGGLFPWDGLRAWHLAHNLLPEGPPLSFPVTASLMALPLQFIHLHKIRAPLGNIEGFDMAPFDALIKDSSEISDINVEVHPLWEYPGKALGVPQEVMTFNFGLSFPQSILSCSGDIPILSEGSLNGVALWMVWKGNGLTLSGGPTKPVVPGKKVEWDVLSRQGVYFLPATSSVSSVKYSITFKPNDILFTFNFSTS